MTDVRQVPLTKGKVALVDAADYKRVTAHEWHAVRSNGRWYAARSTWKPKRSNIAMHRFILGAPPRIHVGFVNGDSLDCRRSNLCRRRGTYHSPSAPQGEPYPRESLLVVEAKVKTPRRYMGVVATENGKFRARIKDRGEYRGLGTYSTERDAALAVNVAARLLRGQDNWYKTAADVNDVPPAVSLDDLEAVIRDLAGLTGTQGPTP